MTIKKGRKEMETVKIEMYSVVSCEKIFLFEFMFVIIFISYYNQIVLNIQ